MEKVYNEYISKVRRLDGEAKRRKFLLAAEPLISEVKTLAKSNAENLSVFKGINIDLVESVEKSINDLEELSVFLQNMKENMHELSLLRSVLVKLETHSLALSSEFEHSVKAFSHKAYENMRSADISSMRKDANNLIYAMDEFEREKAEWRRQEELRREREKAEKRKRIIKYGAIGAGILIGIYILIVFVIPFIMEWWLVILLVVIGIAVLINKIDEL